MYAFAKGKAGIQLEARDGKQFLHRKQRGNKPRISVRVLSDKATSRQIWFPQENGVEFEVDTGAAVS